MSPFQPDRSCPSTKWNVSRDQSTLPVNWKQTQALGEKILKQGSEVVQHFTFQSPLCSFSLVSDLIKPPYLDFVVKTDQNVSFNYNEDLVLVLFFIFFYK